MFHASVAVFTICIGTPEAIRGLDTEVRLPMGKIETPVLLNVMVLEPMLKNVIIVPIGKATDALVGIVIVCGALLVE
jgi:hypothetical protein